MRRVGALVTVAVLAACATPPASRLPPPEAASSPVASPQAAAAGPLGLRLESCREAPERLAGVPPSRGCVATLTQHVSDPATLRWLGAAEVERRYLVYAPAALPAGRIPVVLFFPGATASAEVAASYYTHGRFEALADRDGFIVVYANGLPQSPWPSMKASVPNGGFLRSCETPHHGEGVDVAYVRAVLTELEAELPIDRRHVYATGVSAGGGLCFALAIEAPDLVAAIAPVVPVAYPPSGPALRACNPREGLDEVSIAMVASTDDPFVAYAGGGSRVFPSARNAGMETTRDAWLAALGLSGPAAVDAIPDAVTGDSYEPVTGRTSSTLERQRYGPGADGRELWFYRAVGMGHWWPSPVPMSSGLWSRFGKNNQDVDFADEAWAFFRKHGKSGAPLAQVGLR